jgi:hypothetical protein
MNMNKKDTSSHTPGPWYKGAGFVRSEHGAICKMAHESPIMYAASTGSIENEANARLIAAAPELLEAVKKAADYFSSSADNHELVGVMRMALKKAT